MPKLPMRLLVTGALLLCIAPSLPAQGASRAPGVWGTLSAGAGSSTLTCDQCGDSEGHFTFSPGATLGLTVSRQFALEVDVAGGSYADDLARNRFGYLTAGVVYFPLAQPFSLEAGVGLGRWQGDVPRSGSDARDRVHMTGVAWSVGLGYDVPVATSLALVTRVRMLSSTPTDLRFDSFPSTYQASHRTLQFSMGLTWNLTANPFALRPAR